MKECNKKQLARVLTNKFVEQMNMHHHHYTVFNIDHMMAFYISYDK